MKIVVRSELSSINIANASMSVIDFMAFLYNSRLTCRMSRPSLSSMVSSLVDVQSGDLTRLIATGKAFLGKKGNLQVAGQVEAKVASCLVSFHGTLVKRLIRPQLRLQIHPHHRHPRFPSPLHCDGVSSLHDSQILGQSISPAPFAAPIPSPTSLPVPE